MISVGQHVIYVDETRGQHSALTTAVWGEVQYHAAGKTVPCINIVYTVGDDARTDRYGRQIERQTSVPHYTSQTAPGFCWMLPEELDDALQRFKHMTVQV